MMATFTVYRYYDAADDLLYVGYTSQFRGRDRMHRSTADWSSLIAHVECETFADMDDALDREHELINTLRPRFNKMTRRMNLSHPPRERRAASFRLSPDAAMGLELLARSSGLSMTAVIETIIRSGAAQHGIK